MAWLHHIIRLLDCCLSPDLRKANERELFRARFLVFSILFSIPCQCIPGFVSFLGGGDHSIWIYESLANVFLSLGLLWHVRQARDYRLATAIILVCMHALLIFTFLTRPTVFSLTCFWSPCLIVMTCFIFGLRGAFLSSLVLTSCSIGSVLWHFNHGAAWTDVDAESFFEQLLLRLLGSSLFMTIVMGVYEYLRETSDNTQARQRLLVARHAHTGAVGELVGHIAHEVNNPLAIMQVSVARLRREIERNAWSHDAHKLLGHMQRSHERIIRVQQALAVFSWGNQHEPFVTSDIRTIFKDVQMATKPQAQVQQVALEFLDRSANASFRCQPHQMVYVLCCLIQNALDACRDRPDPQIKVEVKWIAKTLSITVSDNGKGIDEAVQDRVFQPFFSTKTSGHAQGLSLSVSRGIMAEHGGEISFSSRPGHTAFVCHIPQEGAPARTLKRGLA